jgi:hypothetical protein
VTFSIVNPSSTGGCPAWITLPAAFDITFTPKSASKLEFMTANNARTDGAASIYVVALDQYNNLATSYTGSVTLSVASGSAIIAVPSMSFVGGEGFYTVTDAVAETIGLEVSASSITLPNTHSVIFRDTCASGFIPVPGGFCVSKYEMKDSGGGVPVSAAAGIPWSNISFIDAQIKCAALTPAADVITTAQWSAIVTDIGTVAANKNGPNKNNGNITDAPLASSIDGKPCYGYADNRSTSFSTCSSFQWHENRRTHVLSNGEVIWDFSGNLGEWVDDAGNSDVRGGAAFNSLDANDNAGAASATVGFRCTY